jgi:hypothetical protein
MFAYTSKKETNRAHDLSNTKSKRTFGQKGDVENGAAKNHCLDENRNGNQKREEEEVLSLEKEELLQSIRVQVTQQRAEHKDHRRLRPLMQPTWPRSS